MWRCPDFKYMGAFFNLFPPVEFLLIFPIFCICTFRTLVTICANIYTHIKSCYDSAHICPIRAEISTFEHWENVFIFLFV